MSRPTLTPDALVRSILPPRQSDPFAPNPAARIPRTVKSRRTARAALIDGLCVVAEVLHRRPGVHSYRQPGGLANVTEDSRPLTILARW